MPLGPPPWRWAIGRWLLATTLLAPLAAYAHDLSAANAAFVIGADGPAVAAFVYLGAKHMVTGYDHLLYLVAVLFFLANARDVLLYVTLFAVGHSTTLILGVLLDFQVAAWAVDAVIGLSIVYKAFENLNGLRSLRGWAPDPRTAVFLFGLCHGLGLATKLQQLQLAPEGLLFNLVSFNAGVEVGQLLALLALVLLLGHWRRSGALAAHAHAANTMLMVCGFVFAGVHLAGGLA